MKTKNLRPKPLDVIFDQYVKRLELRKEWDEEMKKGNPNITKQVYNKLVTEIDLLGWVLGFDMGNPYEKGKIQLGKPTIIYNPK